MGGQGDDPSQHDRPLPSELVEGALVRVVVDTAVLPRGTEATVVRSNPMAILPTLVVVTRMVDGRPKRDVLDDTEIVVVSPPG